MFSMLMGGYARSSTPPDPNIPNPTFFVDLIAYYKLRETSGSAIDEINAYNGTVTGATRDGIKYTFDGSGDYIDITSALADMKAAAGGTISFYVTLPDATPSGVNYVLFSVGDTDNGSGMILQQNQFLGGRPRLNFQHNYSTKFTVDCTSATLQDGVEAFITITHNGTVPKIYINGVSVTLTNTVGTDLTWWFNDNSLLDNAVIGAANNSGGGYIESMNGSMRDLRIFDRALTDAEVLELYNWGPPEAVAPIIGVFRAWDTFPSRIYFDSTEAITGSNVAGLTVSGITTSITGVVINSGQTTGHYFTINNTITSGDTVTISGTGADTIRDKYNNGLAAFGPSSVVWTVGDPNALPANFKRISITVGDGAANAVIYEPAGVDTPPAGGWPVIIWTGGDGTGNNNTRVFTSISMSTSDSLTYTHSPTSSLWRMMCSEVKIKVNGVIVASGFPGGNIIGPGVTGSIASFDNDSPGTATSPVVTAIFSTNQSGNTITYDYVDTTLFHEGIPRWVNLGDTLDNRCIFIAIQNVQGAVDFDNDYYDKCVEYAWDNYTINSKRISNAGLSRGGRAVIDSPGFLKTRYNHWINRSTGVLVLTDPVNETTHATSGIASLVCGTASYGGGWTAANYTNIGQAIVHATADPTLTNQTFNYASTMEANNEPPYILNLQGGGHNADVWDGKCYKRLYRVGGSFGSLTTADWDYLDFLLKFSKDALECATLHVEQAEKRRFGTEKDIIDWRHANRKVEALTGSAEKTALQGRLTTLKSTINGAGTRWVLNIHNAGNNEASPYANIGTTHTTGTTYSNVIDFEGGASALDFVYTTQSGGSASAIVSARRSWTGGFSKIANNSGVLLTATTGTFGFTGVPAGTYTVRFYHNEGTANYTNNATLTITLNSVTKTQYSAINTLIGYIEFTGVPDTALASFTIARNNDRDTYLTMIEIYKNP